jgi:hypothetical protein
MLLKFSYTQLNIHKVKLPINTSLSFYYVQFYLTFQVPLKKDSIKLIKFKNYFLFS